VKRFGYQKRVAPMATFTVRSSPQTPFGIRKASFSLSAKKDPGQDLKSPLRPLPPPAGRCYNSTDKRTIKRTPFFLLLSTNPSAEETEGVAGFEVAPAVGQTFSRHLLPRKEPFLQTHHFFSRLGKPSRPESIFLLMEMQPKDLFFPLGDGSL